MLVAGGDAQQCSGGSGGISANAISRNFNLWSLDPGQGTEAVGAPE